MTSIPPDMYERVHELTVALTNASLAIDDALAGSLYQTLIASNEEQACLERAHPFLTEAVADFADDAAGAALYYEKALQQARNLPGEPVHTKMISLAERLMELGKTDQARAFLQAGRAKANQPYDFSSVVEADRLLQETKA